ncbi:hypothetical protein CDAR_121161 [Caerostris darwini]|uniref:Uncharacterized protein n=1 Tax=Caerostris darwini TaxID=1538125 RepID=A0AAV4VGP2_9ARAC|nr:hypothetical protein CDAR_121161 [Caerostris darwini]
MNGNCDHELAVLEGFSGLGTDIILIKVSGVNVSLISQSSLKIETFVEARLVKVWFTEPRKVGLLPVGPREVFYFPPTTHRRPMEASPDPPPGDAASRGYRLPRGYR